MPRVINLKTEDGRHAVLIDRTTRWGNPFVIGPDGDRDEVCDKYAEWVETSPAPDARWIRDHIAELRGRDLACHCKPMRCHGDFLLALAKRWARP